MTDDLVRRLRDQWEETPPYVCHEAADRIEELTSRNKELEAALRKIEAKHWYPTTAEIAREALGEK